MVFLKNYHVETKVHGYNNVGNNHGYYEVYGLGHIITEAKFICELLCSEQWETSVCDIHCAECSACD